MKKSLIITVLLLIFNNINSQDIYTAGSYTNSDGSKAAAVFKNGVVIYSLKQDGKDLFSSAMAVDTTNKDIYWSLNSNPVGSISDGYGCVMKNDEIVLDNMPGTCINDISLDGCDIYSAGYMNDIYNATAAVWKNGDTTPLYTYCADQNYSEVLGIDVVNGVVYACGFFEQGLRTGCVWVNGELYATYPNCKVTDIAYNNGDIYYVVSECLSMVYKSGEQLYNMYNHYSGECSDVNDLKVVNDDVYAVGFLGYNDCIVWKNDDLLYLHPYAHEADFRACCFYDQSLYYVGWDDEGNGLVLKDGEILYSMKNYAFYSVWVVPSPLSIEEMETSDNSIVFIYNIFGEIVKTMYSEEDTLTITDLPAGIYIVKRDKSVMKFMKCF